MTIQPKFAEETAIRYREQAQQLAKLRDQSFSKSKSSQRNGNKKKAKDYYKEGKAYQKRMIDANKIASEIIFSRHNKRRTKGTIDLHGLFVSEAIEKLKARIASAKRKEFNYLVVIVGKGNNSRDGPKIKPAVIKYARENQIPMRKNFPNPGCVCLELSRFISHRASICSRRYVQSDHSPVSLPSISRYKPEPLSSYHQYHDYYDSIDNYHDEYYYAPIEYHKPRNTYQSPSPDNHVDWRKWLFRIAVCLTIFFVGKFLLWIFRSITAFISNLFKEVSYIYASSNLLTSIAGSCSGAIESAKESLVNMKNIFISRFLSAQLTNFSWNNLSVYRLFNEIPKMYFYNRTIIGTTDFFSSAVRNFMPNNSVVESFVSFKSFLTSRLLAIIPDSCWPTSNY